MMRNEESFIKQSDAIITDQDIEQQDDREEEIQDHYEMELPIASIKFFFNRIISAALQYDMVLKKSN
jgi:hypothetical protein